MVDAVINEILLIGGGIFFLVSFETRQKRKRVIETINKLRCMAHIIDVHQLTKDPAGLSEVSAPTPHSPKRTLNRNELCRYLDYCSEMLSLVSKLGFLYIQDFPDAVATDAVNDLEILTTDFSRKIWQKIMVTRP